MRLILAQIGDNKTVKFVVKEIVRLIKTMDDSVVLDIRKYREKDPSVKNALWVGLDGSMEISGKDGIYIKVENGVNYFSVASGGGTGRTLHPDNMAAGPSSYGMTDTMGRMHSDAQFAGSSSVPAHVEMMGLIGAGNNPMVGMTVACAVAVEEASK